MTADPLIAHLRRTTRELNDRAGVRDHLEALERVIYSAVATVPGACAAGLTVADDRYLDFVRATDIAVVGKLDTLQRELDEGPASVVLDACPEDGIATADDLAGEDAERWPTFAAHAVDAGHRSMVSVLLEVDGGPRAALNLYGTGPDTFDAHARRAAGVLGLTAGMLLLAAENAEQLQKALDSRDVIGRAKGVLMERFDLDQNGAFAMLREASQETNMKLVDVARWVDEERAATGGEGQGRGLLRSA